MPEPAGSPRSGARRRRGRRAGRVLVLLGALPLLMPAVPAGAQAPAPPAPAAAGEVLCSITDPGLAEVSGLVVVGERMLAMNDGGDRLTVHVLDRSCRVTQVRTADVDPYDPEDLALAADGTIWIADTGDNAADRPTVALHALRTDGTAALYRLAYPDGPHDAEALLLAPDGTPYLVTKEVLGASAVYRPVSALIDGGTVALEEVARVNLTLTGTPGGPVGRAGQLMVTGGAVAPDGEVLALRTYTDAYLWPLDGSDVPGALAGAPVRVALPESPQGEAISFATDHRRLVVASEGLPSDVLVVSTDAALAPVAETLPAPGDPAAAPVRPTPSPWTSGLIAAGVATVAVWTGGKLRRRAPA